MVCHATGETVLHKAARLGYEVLQCGDMCKLAVTLLYLKSVCI